eukprot:360614-Chlamydomonas_euryale.AAC.1
MRLTICLPTRPHHHAPHHLPLRPGARHVPHRCTTVCWSTAWAKPGNGPSSSPTAACMRLGSHRPAAHGGCELRRQKRRQGADGDRRSRTTAPTRQVLEPVRRMVQHL